MQYKYVMYKTLRVTKKTEYLSNFPVRNDNEIDVELIRYQFDDFDVESMLISLSFLTGFVSFLMITKKHDGWGSR